MTLLILLSISIILTIPIICIESVCEYFKKVKKIKNWNKLNREEKERIINISTNITLEEFEKLETFIPYETDYEKLKIYELSKDRCYKIREDLKLEKRVIKIEERLIEEERLKILKNIPISQLTIN